MNKLILTQYTDFMSDFLVMPTSTSYYEINPFPTNLLMTFYFH